MNYEKAYKALVAEIQVLLVRQVELGTINPNDVFPPTRQLAISGQAKDGAALLYLNHLVSELKKKD